EIKHEKNPLLDIAVKNAMAKNTNDSIMIEKKKNREKIDPLMSSIFAYVIACEHQWDVETIMPLFIYEVKMELNKIYNEECLEGMKRIPDGSVDMILCDLPYGTTRNKWDSIIPLDKLWEQYNRIIKDNGAIVLTAQTPFDKVLGTSNLKMLKYEWIWEKTTATGWFNAKKMPMKAHENILVFYKKPPVYNYEKTKGHKPMNSYTKRVDVINKSTTYGKVKKDMSGGGETERYP